MVYCTFSGIQEQTSNDELSPIQTQNSLNKKSYPKEKDMRCFFKGRELTVVTRGGLKYVNNTRLEIQDVYPLEDGVLIKVLYNHDLVSFELGVSPPIGTKP